MAGVSQWFWGCRFLHLRVDAGVGTQPWTTTLAPIEAGITVLGTLVGVVVGAFVTWWLERGRRKREDRDRFIVARQVAYETPKRNHGEPPRHGTCTREP